MSRTKVLEVRKLPVKMTEEEVADCGRLLVERMTQRDEVAAEKAEAMSTFKDRLELADGLVQAARESIQTGEKKVDVECDVVYSWEENKVSVVRKDTGEVVEERAMDAAEREELSQGQLPGETVQ